MASSHAVGHDCSSAGRRTQLVAHRVAVNQAAGTGSARHLRGSLAYCRLWVRAKFNVVKRFNVSSLRKGREIAAKGQTPEEKGLHFPEYACHGGGEFLNARGRLTPAFPIWIAGCDSAPIGAIVVSGLPQLEDHQLIIDSLAKADKLFHP